MREFDPAGRTAFVAGGGSGIGLAIAARLAAAGAKVAIADIRGDRVEQAVAGLPAGRAAGVTLDVADLSAFGRAADEVEAQLGPVSIVVSNAGVYLPTSAEETSPEDFAWLLGINLQGVINAVHTFVPRMKERAGGGHLVNGASMSSFLASACAGAYTTAGYAVRGLSESLRWSLAPHGIGVSCLCPGLVQTSIHESLVERAEQLGTPINERDREFMERLSELYRFATSAEDVADHVMDGMRRNDLYIFPHPEFRGELREAFDEIIAAFPEPATSDAGRLHLQRIRREVWRGGKERISIN